MTTEQRRRIDLVLEDGFTSDLSSEDLDTLRAKRAMADEVETELSYYRRLLHGRLDLLAFEMRRRAGTEQRTLMEALPEILSAGETTGDRGGRLPGALAPELPDKGQRAIDRVLDDDFLSRLPSLSDAELDEIQDLLTGTERDVSAQRQAVQDVFDEIQTEILGRYKEGQAGPEGLLTD